MNHDGIGKAHWGKTVRTTMQRTDPANFEANMDRTLLTKNLEHGCECGPVSTGVREISP